MKLQKTTYLFLGLLLSSSSMFAQTTYTVNLNNGDTSGNLVQINQDVTLGDTLKIINNTATTVSGSNGVDDAFISDGQGANITLDLLAGEAYNYVLNDSTTQEIVIVYTDGNAYYNTGFTPNFITQTGLSITEKPRILAHPNPVVNTFVITNINQELGLELYNFIGEKLWSKTTQIELNIDFSNYPTGLYYLKVIRDSKLAETLKIQKI